MGFLRPLSLELSSWTRSRLVRSRVLYREPLEMLNIAPFSHLSHVTT